MTTTQVPVSGQRSLLSAVAVILASASLILLAGCSKMRAGSAYERAEQHAAKGELSAALGEVKAALVSNQQDIRARLLLAQLLVKASDLQGARQSLEQAIAYGAKPDQVTGLNYAILQGSNDYQGILDAAVKDELSVPATKLLYRSFGLAGLEKLDEALLAIDEAARLAPSDAAIQVARARLYFQAKRYAEATDIVEAVLKQNDKLAEAWWLKGQLLQQAQKNADAYAALTTAVAADRGQLDLLQSLMLRANAVELALQLNKLDEAEAGLRPIMAASPDSPVTAYLAARLDLIKKDPKSAVARTEAALRQAPKHAGLRLLLGTALLAQGAPERAEAELLRLLSDYPEHTEARKLLARSYLARNRAAEARKLLAAAPTSLTVDAQSEYLQGAAALGSGKLPEAIAHLEKSVAAQPADANISLDLATAYIADGAREKAIALLDALPAEKKTAARRSALRLFAQVVGRNREQSDIEVGKLLARNANDAGLHEIAATYYLRAGNLVRAHELLVKAVLLDPAQTSARLRLAAIDQRMGNLPAVETDLAGVLGIDPKNEPALLAMAALASQKEDRAAARKYLETVVGAHPNTVQARFALAELAFAEHNPKQANGFLDQAVTVANGNAAVVNKVGEVLLAAGERDAAVTRFTEAASLGLQEAQFNIAKLYTAESRLPEARKALESVLADKPFMPAALVMIAELDAREGRVQAALRRADDLKKSSLPEPVLAELQGDIHSFVKGFAKASALYDSAYAAAPSQRLALKQYRIRRLGKLPNELIPLTAWLQRAPADSEANFALGAYYQESGNRAAAIRAYEQSVTTNSKPNPAILNNLAWLYHEQGDSRALELAKRAHTMAPKVGTIADTYGWILVAGGKYAEAELILEKAAATEKSNLEIQYHLAVAQARTGNKAKAKITLTEILKPTNQFAQRAEAEKLLQSVSGG